MKKMIWILLVGLLFLFSCQPTVPKASKPNKLEQNGSIKQKNLKSTFAYPNLLAGNNTYYSLLTIGKPDEHSPIEKNKKVTKSVHDILSLPYPQAKKIYPKLNIDHDPEYFLFDQNGVIFTTTKLNDLTMFLQKNKQSH